MSNLYAFTASYPLKAAAELREAGYDAFALMMPERRQRHRHAVKGPTAKARKWKSEPVVALSGYVFAHMDMPNAWAISQMKHVRNAVRNARGCWQVIPAKEAAWLMDPPHPLFHDTDIPRFLNRPAPPVVKAGDMVRFTLACEEHTRPVQSVDGETLLLEIRILSRDVKVRVPISMVEAA